MKLTDIKRQNIIDAAIVEFREQGFLGAKTTAIAKRADVSSRTLYKHFESKEALFEAICEIMVAQNSVMGPVAYAPDRPLKAQLTEALTTYVGVITDDVALGLNRVVMSELLRDMERSRAFFSEVAAHDYPITRLVEEAMAAGALRQADPAFATGQLLALVKNIFFWPEFFLGGKVAAPEALSDSIDMFLAHYATE